GIFFQAGGPVEQFHERDHHERGQCCPEVGGKAKDDCSSDARHYPVNKRITKEAHAAQHQPHAHETRHQRCEQSTQKCTYLEASLEWFQEPVQYVHCVQFSFFTMLTNSTPLSAPERYTASLLGKFQPLNPLHRHHSHRVPRPVCHCQFRQTTR